MLRRPRPFGREGIINLLLDELRRKNAELERFTYSVAHELKSPLIAISGFAGYLRKDIEDRNDARIEEDIKQIDAAVERMRRLIDELLELSRNGRQISEPTDISLGDLAREAVENLRGQISAGNVKVRIADDLPSVRGDPLRLLEVVRNLLDNAIKFTADQPQATIDVGARRDGDQIVCFVRDNGCGIEPDLREQIFELFRQLEPCCAGSGIGLSLVRRIIEKHGGKVWAESEGHGTGSTFCFTLPIV